MYLVLITDKMIEFSLYNLFVFFAQKHVTPNLSMICVNLSLSQ